MGQRANLVIVYNNDYELYYNHWCASSMPEKVFWGPVHTRQFIESQEKVSKTEWLNDIWAEGGVVMDLDQQYLLFYGGEDMIYDIQLRQLFIQLMHKVWTGWQVEWAEEGILDMANYVGVSPECVLSSRQDTELRLLEPIASGNFVDGVASIQFGEDELLLFPLGIDFKEYLYSGSEIIEHIDKTQGYSKIIWKDWAYQDEIPSSGFHVDKVSRTLQFWHAEAIPNILAIVKECWPGWNISRFANHYDSQVAAAKGRLVILERDTATLLEELTKNLLREPNNPVHHAISIAELLGESGKEVQLNPDIFSHTGYHLSLEEKRTILAYALRSYSDCRDSS